MFLSLCKKELQPYNYSHWMVIKISCLSHLLQEMHWLKNVLCDTQNSIVQNYSDVPERTQIAFTVLLLFKNVFSLCLIQLKYTHVGGRGTGLGSVSLLVMNWCNKLIYLKLFEIRVKFLQEKYLYQWQTSHNRELNLSLFYTLIVHVKTWLQTSRE